MKVEKKYCLDALAKKLIRPSGLTEKEFANRARIPWSTYQKDKTVLVTDSFCMPESRLQVYAKAFGVKMEDLINYEVEQKCLVSNFDEDNSSIIKRIRDEFER